MIFPSNANLENVSFIIPGRPPPERREDPHLPHPGHRLCGQARGGDIRLQGAQRGGQQEGSGRHQAASAL